MEALRIWPTAAVFAVKPIRDAVLAGKYPLTTKDTVVILEPMLHRDPHVWGEDAEAFRPERFAPENAEKLPPNAWKPFGNGKRACIGRAFAMQEAQLVLAMMLQRFDIVLDDPSYRLEIAETLTIKPHGLRIRARARHRDGLWARSVLPAAPQRPLTAPPAAPTVASAAATPLIVLFGSNSGSCEAFAGRIASDAPQQGYAPTLGSLDDFTGRLAAAHVDTPLIVVTASYEGQPPDNARQFVPWLEGLEAGALAGLKYAVFGCGNRQWARTYQAIPIRIDAALTKAGAVRLRARGETDAGGDFFGAFDEWYAGLWGDLGRALGKAQVAQEEAAGLEVEVVRTGRESALRLADLQQGAIVENRELVNMSAPHARSKRHIEIALPTGMTYQSGDYLAVLPRNPAPVVERALRRFSLASDTQVIVRGRAGAAAFLPMDYPVSAFELLSNYVELAQPATRGQVTALAAATRCPPEQQALQTLAADGYEADVLGKRLSVLDLMELFHACELTFARFLAMLPPMRARQYSISSSPLWNEKHVTLTIAVVDAPALSGQNRFRGVASSYLASLEPGARLSVAVRASNARFHPPRDPATPLIMVCAGSGVAPFRGFLQERAVQKQGGQPVGPALLFFGVDHPDVDYLYGDEFATWESEGVVTMCPTFSAAPERNMPFVQHRLWQERERIADLFRDGASVFVCGDGRHMAPAVRETFIRIYRDAVGASEQEAAAWAERVEHEHGRYVADVFA
jgi:cytochrome P450/NADPH-cytochrome P450 reductase